MGFNDSLKFDLLRVFQVVDNDVAEPITTRHLFSVWSHTHTPDCICHLFVHWGILEFLTYYLAIFLTVVGSCFQMIIVINGPFASSALLLFASLAILRFVLRGKLRLYVGNIG